MATFTTGTGVELTPLRWYNQRNGQAVGIVLLVDRNGAPLPYFKVYIGIVVPTHSEAGDARHIADHGTPLGDEELARQLAGDRVADIAYAY